MLPMECRAIISEEVEREKKYRYDDGSRLMDPRLLRSVLIDKFAL